MKPIVDGLEEEYAGQVSVVRFDIDDPSTAEAKATYKFRLQPYYVLLDADGEVIETWVGGKEKSVFVEAFAGVLGQ
jgi:hypothetical protein